MLTVVVLGASGDLARRKTYPAIFALYRHRLLPRDFSIIGYARSELSKEELHEKLTPFLKKTVVSQHDRELLTTFLERCEYVSGAYDAPEGYLKVREMIQSLPPVTEPAPFDNVQLFYLALPPSIFTPAAAQIKEHLYNSRKENRIIVEKPFGRDLQSSNELAASLSPLFGEGETFRIDHYLGKEMVKNIMILRFANTFFNAIWDRRTIHSVQIVFKETLGVEGRGGYFDEFGIIRDVMQNHLLQMLTVVAMDRPATLDAEDVRDEKVKVLRCIAPLTLPSKDVVIGQYTRSVDGTRPGYLEDETIPPNSNTPTFAMAVLHIKNDRWDGVPFVLRCGKGLNEQKAEIRIRFHDVPGPLFPDAASNELVLRVQPNESVYMKMMVKRPGLDSEPIVSDLDLSYANRYIDLRIPEAYESLILDALKGDRSNFVRSDELEYAWKIFTPLLYQLETTRIRPVEYPFGSRGPPDADALLRELGVVTPAIHQHQRGYSWPRQQL